MTARVQQPRKKTARELAEKFGVSERTIRNHMAAERSWWVAQRHELREKAATMRDTGMTWKQVGETLGITEGSARALAKRARGRWGNGPQPLITSRPG
jgi:predicted transcriptional regulator